MIKQKPIRERLIIVGNGMVSHQLCLELSKRNANENFEIRIFGDEPTPAYDRVHLTDYFKTLDTNSLSLGTKEWYSNRGYKLKTGTRIRSINSSSKQVTDLFGTNYEYDKLILATGSHPFIPPIQGIGANSVFAYRTLADAAKILSYAKGKRSAIVLGGGLLGLEAANALRELEIQTSVVELANGLLPRQLDQDASRVLEQQIRDLGVNPILGKGVGRIEESEGGLIVHYNDQSTSHADMLVVATGVKPADELGATANLKLGARGGIVVDDTLRSSDSSIFAIGECALHRGQLYGFVAPGYQMAEVLANNLCGGSSSYHGSDLSCRLKLMGIEVSAFGDYLEEGRTLVHRTANTYRKIVLRRDSFAGGTVVGDWDQTHLLQLAINEERFMTPSEQANFEREGTLPSDEGLALWPNNAIICNCTQTTKGELSKYISSGCKTIQQLADATGASTVCGSCQPLLAQLCGQTGQEAAYHPRGRRLLWLGAATALIFSVLLLSLRTLPPPETVQNSYYEISQIWQDSTYKQVSGYSMAGLSLIAILLSARKRIRALRFGNFGWWRAIHGILGTLCLLALVAHTGLDFGENLNLWLMTCFVGLNLVGALAGLSIAMEDRFEGLWSRRIRSLVTKAHILFFWPYPVLLGFHIYKAYAY